MNSTTVKELYDIIGGAEDQLDEHEVRALELLVRGRPNYLPVIRMARQEMTEPDFLTLLKVGFVDKALELRIDATIADRIESGEVVYAGNLARGNTPARAWSAGMTPKIGCEVFSSGFKVEHLNHLNRNIGEMLIANPKATETDFTETLYDFEQGLDIVRGRWRLERISLQRAIDAQIIPDMSFFYGVEPHHELVVVVLADRNNILPGEEGYQWTGIGKQFIPSILESMEPTTTLR